MFLMALSKSVAVIPLVLDVLDVLDVLGGADDERLDADLGVEAIGLVQAVVGGVGVGPERIAGLVEPALRDVGERSAVLARHLTPGRSARPVRSPA